MRTVLSYMLLLTLALSGLTGSVQPAHALTLADSIVAQQQLVAAIEAETPCHSAPENTATTAAEHDCCEQVQQQCQSDCCAKHCATSGALLAAELFRYISPNNKIANHVASLPEWLFAAESPPPINA
jgi:hypothetical protein